MNGEIQFVKSRKGKTSLIRNGFKYNLSRKNKMGTTLWRCWNREECSATITCKSNQLIRENREHTCSANKIRNEILSIMDKCKQDVCHDFRPIQQIFEDNFVNFKRKGEEYCEAMPSFASKKNELYKARRDFLQVDRLHYNRLRDIKLSSTLNDKFFVCEDGDDEKIVIFASPLVRKFLKTYKGIYYADGTFKAAPSPFYQVYTLHIDLGSTITSTNIVPAIYVLLPNKTEETYSRLFKLLKDNLSINIKHFKCDFELAPIKGVRAIFPTIRVTGCFYHYNKAIWRKGKELNVKKMKDGRNILRKVALIPLLPSNKIDDALNVIWNDAPQNPEMIKFMQYYQHQWSNKTTQILSCAEDKHRTTNSLEGWHRRLNTRIPKTPNLYLVIYTLKKESIHYDSLINKSLFQTLTRKNRRRLDIQFDKEYQKLLKKLIDGDLGTKPFLKKIIYLRLKCKNKLKTC